MQRILLTLLLLVLAGTPLRAVTTDEVIQLTQNGIGDDLIIAMMQSDRSTFALTPEEISRLQAAGVSDRVIQTMRGQTANPTLPPAATSPLDRESRRVLARKPAVLQADPVTVVPRPVGKAQLTLRNRDSRVGGWVWDEGRRELRIFATATAGVTALAQGSDATIDLEPGTLDVRWENEYQHHRVHLPPGMRLEAFLESGVGNGQPAIRLAFVRDGHFWSAYNLKVFYGRSGPPTEAPPGKWVSPGPHVVVIPSRPIPVPPAPVVIEVPEPVYLETEPVEVPPCPVGEDECDR